MNNSMRFRQVHLDFHTSEKISCVGSQFSKKQFQQTLLLGHVDSITLFSKCHHGLSYHPTKVGQMHPGLNFNLLGEQIIACKEIGVKTPVYLSAGADQYYYANNPGDAVVDKKPLAPLEIGYRRLCFNTDYLDYLCRQIEEVVASFDCDGIFLDIIGLVPCYCQKCLANMFELGMDPRNDKDVTKFAVRVQRNYYEQTLAAVRKNDPNIPIFQNAGHISKGDREFLRYVSHLELESLPTGNWGYDHFPASAKYCDGLDIDFLGMTGKFHTTWGEFGGFKHKNALLYETSLMLAFGSRCSIGDQMHPSALLNEDTYARIGLAYAEVKKKESYCLDARQICEVAILSVEAMNFKKHGWNPAAPPADTGVQRMLLEKHVLFDIIDDQMDFNVYRMIIVPDERCLDAATAKKLHEFVDSGGKLVLSYQSGLRPDSDQLFFEIGEYCGINEFNPDYIRIGQRLLEKDIDGNLVKSPFVVYQGSVNIKTDGIEYAAKINPFFNRTIKHFCSHQHAPDHKKSEFPAVFVKGNICYFTNKIFTAYADHGQMLYRDLFYAVMKDMLGGFIVSTSLQSAGRISFTHQPTSRRYVLHLLYASPVKRAGNAIPQWNIKDIEVIEDIVTINNIRCEVVLDKNIKRVSLPLSTQPLEFTQNNNKVQFIIPELWCHQIVIFEY